MQKICWEDAKLYLTREKYGKRHKSVKRSLQKEKNTRYMVHAEVNKTMNKSNLENSVTERGKCYGKQICKNNEASKGKVNIQR